MVSDGNGEIEREKLSGDPSRVGSIRFNCTTPQCGQDLAAMISEAGATKQCPICGNSSKVPMPRIRWKSEEALAGPDANNVPNHQPHIMDSKLLAVSNGSRAKSGRVGPVIAFSVIGLIGIAAYLLTVSLISNGQADDIDKAQTPQPQSTSSISVSAAAKPQPVAKSSSPRTTAPSQASFDCAKATTETENMICSSAELGGLDGELGATYSRLIKSVSNSDAKNLRQSQREWLRNIRNLCRDEACLANAYRARLEELNSYGG